MPFTQSEAHFEDAKSILVGGVNSPVRAFNAVGGHPVFMQSGNGPLLRDVDDQEYIDYVLAYGPLLLGHNDPDVTHAIKTAAENSTTFGAPTANETQLAKLIQQFYPNMEKCRLVNSGTEATMSAIRLARGVTGRKHIVKFNGCYHGHSDALLVSAGSGSLTLGKPSSAGVPEEFTQFTHVVEFNDSAAINALFESHGHDIACIILEPVCGNMGVILPQEGFLETLRACCDAAGALLIFDEVMCGFRLEGGSAQAKFGVQADLVCLGKVIGGGLPCGAYGGRADIMAHLAPEGDVYQAGTLSGNPLVVAAGIAVLSKLLEIDILNTAIANTKQLVNSLELIIEEQEAPCTITQCGTMFTLFFTTQTPSCLNDVQNCDFDLFKRFYQAALKEGLYFAPSQYEANFVSISHEAKHLAKTTALIRMALKKALKTPIIRLKEL